ncbi:uncharacterized protein LOC117787057 [Drosophila innubila]|uniref:uncharacterized protein LOC117787057 n=1 Tax=Drosophila innubila TaxID=198719 RepID=UPI00148CAF07|nr:uncharacterized protein LOC117787057 [Drosophila innubila]
MSSSNATLYYTAMEDMFKDLLLDTDSAEQVDTMENEMPLMDTPKRLVRIRQHNLFTKDKEEFFICRRLPLSSQKLDASPRSQEMHKEQQGKELLRLRRERCEGNQKKPMRRLTMRI